MDASLDAPEFPRPQSMGERQWGSEDLLCVSSSHYTMKRLFIQAGKKGGLQKHRLKDESGYIVSGKLIIRYDNGHGQLVEKILGKGDCFRFPPGSVHQEEALSDCVIIECSTPHLNDRVRCEIQYGLQQEGGLETTSIDEIETL